MRNVPLHHIVFALVLAVPLVALPMDAALLVGMTWLIFVGYASWLASKHQRGFATFMTYVAVTLLATIAAYLAPVKTSEKSLDQRIVLPKTQLTLTEMDFESNPAARDCLMPFATVRPAPETASQVIQFPGTELTLHEFVQTIEKQSKLRHRFHYCGNGYSVLFGGGGVLWLSEPREFP